MRIVPLSAGYKLSMTEMAVVLPAPFGPSRPNNVPASTWREKSFKATVSPNRFVTWSSAMMDTGTQLLSRENLYKDLFPFAGIFNASSNEK